MGGAIFTDVHPICLDSSYGSCSEPGTVPGPSCHTQQNCRQDMVCESTGPSESTLLAFNVRVVCRLGLESLLPAYIHMQVSHTRTHHASCTGVGNGRPGCLEWHWWGGTQVASPYPPWPGLACHDAPGMCQTLATHSAALPAMGGRPWTAMHAQTKSSNSVLRASTSS